MAGRTGAGGSSNVTPFEASSVMSGLSDYLGKQVKVLYARGLPSTDDIFKDTDWGNKTIKVEVFNNPNFNGAPQVHSAERIAGFKSEEFTPEAKHHRSIRYTAEYLPKNRTSLVLAGAGGSDTYTVFINSKKVLEQPHREGQAPQFADVQMTAGQPVKVQVDYLPDADYPRIGVGIHSTDDLVSPEVAKLAAMSDATVVAVGFDPSTESEGFDRFLYASLGTGRADPGRECSQQEDHRDADRGRWRGHAPLARRCSSLPAQLVSRRRGRQGYR